MTGGENATGGPCGPIRISRTVFLCGGNERRSGQFAGAMVDKCGLKAGLCRTRHVPEQENRARIKTDAVGDRVERQAGRAYEKFHTFSRTGDMRARRPVGNLATAQPEIRVKGGPGRGADIAIACFDPKCDPIRHGFRTPVHAPEA